MKSLYLERSTGEVRSGDWVEKLDLEGVERLVVGIGPGSFAGIRSALAFALGYAAANEKVEVFGLPSPCALQDSADKPLCVVGDARQGMYWVALFDGFKLICPIYQVDKEGLGKRVPRGVKMLSPDHKRIGELLKEYFGDFYCGEAFPTAQGLERFAEANPSALIKEPLPIYLNPAVRS